MYHRFCRVIRIVIPSIMLFLLAYPVLAQSPEPIQGLDAYIAQSLTDWNVPGLAIAVIRDDEIVLARGYGIREIGKGQPVDAHTLFGIGSTTKAFTAALVAMAVDEGQLTWDSRVVDHLPNFQLRDPWVTREITIRDLLAHRTGLASAEGLWYVFGYDRRELAHRFRYVEPLLSFRSGYSYNNAMYLTVGLVLEAVTGASWDDLVAKRILTPLGMNESNTSITALAGMENVASPHFIVDGQLTVIPRRNVNAIGPAGSINSNAVDMAQWLRLQLGQGVYEGQRLVSQENMQEMHTPQTVYPVDVDDVISLLYPDPLSLDYALGWYTYNYHAHRVVEHTGSVDGMYSLVSMIPQESLGLVILTNINSTRLPFALRSRIFDSYLGLPERDWSTELRDATLAYEEQVEAIIQEWEPKRVADTKPSLQLSEYAGSFANELYGQITITEAGGELEIQFGPNPKKEALAHWHFDIFQIDFESQLMPKLPVTFIIDINGQVAYLEVPELGRFERVAEM